MLFPGDFVKITQFKKFMQRKLNSFFLNTYTGAVATTGLDGGNTELSRKCPQAQT